MGFHQLVGRHGGGDEARVGGDGELLVHHQLHAHRAQQLHGGGHVVQMRDVTDGDRAVGQQRGGQDRQHRVLGAGNLDFAV